MSYLGRIFESYKIKGAQYQPNSPVLNLVDYKFYFITHLENIGFDLTHMYINEYKLFNNGVQVGLKFTCYSKKDWWMRFEVWYKYTGEILLRLTAPESDHKQFQSESGLKPNPKQKTKKQFPTLYDILDNPIEIDTPVVYAKGNAMHMGLVKGWGNKKLSVTSAPRSTGTVLVYPKDCNILDQDQFVMHLLKN